MKIALHRHMFCAAALAATAASLAGCETERGINDPWPQTETLCNRQISVPEVKSDSRALIVTDPAALARLQLGEVLQQFLTLHGEKFLTPQELMQRLFDTSNDTASARFQNNYHCDSGENPAYANGKAAFCPRAEGKLAESTGFFKEGDPDQFYPVAVVNRIDLMTPFTDCGQYRIVYAKRSGLTDPNNRVFLILEGTLPTVDADFNEQGTIMCQDIAEFWSDLDAETDTAKMADKLHTFFLDGIPNRGPVIVPSNFGFGGLTGTGYYGTTGQVRLSQHVNGEWEYRELHLGTSPGSDPIDGPLQLVPAPVGNNPIPALFDAATSEAMYPQAPNFPSAFAELAVPVLAVNDVFAMSMSILPEDLSGESVLGGPAVNDYAAAAAENTTLRQVVDDAIKMGLYSKDCPSDDPLNAEAILNRATVESCAGCHAPTQFLGAERKLGCGMTWPESLNPTHIDEHGAISPAMKDTFLPHRAKVMTRVLQACSNDELSNGGVAPIGSTTKSLRRRTLGGSVTH